MTNEVILNNARISREAIARFKRALARFKRAYLEAKRNGQETFRFAEQEVTTDYAKYAIEYAEKEMGAL